MTYTQHSRDERVKWTKIRRRVAEEVGSGGNYAER